MTLANSLPWRGDPADITAEFDPDTAHAAFVATLADLLPDWTIDAACAGTDLSVWFPSRGQRTPAKTICSTCPVRQQCLAEALADPNLDHGIRGGLTANERRTERTR